MPEMNNLEATYHINKQQNVPYVVILTLKDNIEKRVKVEVLGTVVEEIVALLNLFLVHDQAVL